MTDLADTLHPVFKCHVDSEIDMVGEEVEDAEQRLLRHRRLVRVIVHVHCDDVTYVHDDVTYVYDDVTYAYDDATYVYDDASLCMSTAMM